MRARAYLLRITALILLLCICLASCSEKDGGWELSFSEAGPYSAATAARATDTVYSLLLHYARGSSVQSLPEATLISLRARADGIYAAVAERPTDERAFLRIIDALDALGEAAIDELLAHRAGEGGSLDTLRSLYYTLSSEVGSDYIGGLIYRLGLYSYDYNYDKKLADYGKYGYAYLLEDANKIDEERAVFKNEIGEDSFILTVRLGLILAEAASGGSLGAEALQSFSEAEIATFVHALSPRPLTLSDKAWELVLSLILPKDAPSEDARLSAKLLYEFGISPDRERLAGELNSLVSLISDIAEGFTEESASLLREGERRELFFRLIASQDEAWRCRFEELFGSLREGERYTAIAEADLGEEFNDYRDSVTVYTAEELFLSVSADEFYERLEGYIAGISPAISFVFFK
ncbi:MAG: hypothetical protein IKA64_06825 [Clostridia bacterium]|nr:hypothetical protein [Clostridia bacterium]